MVISYVLIIYPYLLNYDFILGSQLQIMGRHKVWRNVAKKMRRKRLRRLRAQERDAVLEAARRKQESSPTYQAWVRDQEALEQFREEEEARLSEERNREWLLAEVKAQQLWQIRQDRAEKARKEREETEMRIRKEWEEEQKKQELIELEKKKEQEEKLRKQEELMKQIVDFVEKGGERPSFANDVNETNPNKPLCPFFIKTGACRFGDRCSRNHPRPALSKIVMVPNFYSHFGMDQSMLDEYDTDLLLEYEDSETYQHFREFYNDVVPELFRYGRLVAVVICRNSEPHLRGNVYVEYEKEAEAAKAVTSLNGRWYGGKQLSAQFTSIPSWKAAICGLFHRGRCPKGKACNFLHVFHNPGGEFFNPDRERERLTQKRKGRRERDKEERDFSERGSSRRGAEESSRRSRRRRESSKREWRWSESPERVAYPRESGRDEEENDESERGTVAASPDSMYRNSRNKEKTRRRSRERRDNNGSHRGQERVDDVHRGSSRRSGSREREESNHSSSRERHGRGSERHHTRRKRPRDSSVESRRSHHDRQTRETSCAMNKECVIVDRGCENGSGGSGVEGKSSNDCIQVPVSNNTDDSE
ncbi:U2 small nuclear ribonucleoprotein auxiliary factor 35 kDa subunit-related protein 1 [Ischnura elegans]|uniref:U2 small nuclear ribonucleoprotein auxiliary factor 35 kDa subunit-related protein 1 n=1 Tax=Ischnura elegans TaxID=197161 RepID=UPI001ED8BFB3|nr:U2 small nuclear ribonucleoprotein auxiliary factor 35 kDa subunit-related protein 1 [Ischnura elegans]